MKRFCGYLIFLVNSQHIIDPQLRHFGFLHFFLSRPNKGEQKNTNNNLFTLK